MKLFPCIGKRPATQNGLYDATDDQKTLQKWAEHFPECNWGMPTGDGIIILDFDKKSNGLDTLGMLTLPKTKVVKTPGGGFHYYFTGPKGIKNKVGLLAGMDIRADGGYVLVPPSAGYQLIGDNEMAPIPGTILELLQERKPVEASVTAEVAEGGRNHYLTRVAGKLQRMGLLTLDGLLAINHRDCNPPLDEYEVRTIFESVGKYAQEVAIDTSVPYVKAGDLFESFKDYISNPHKVVGEPTGIPGLDKMLGGGIRPGEVLGVLAPNKVGKSSFTHKILFHWLEKNLQVGYASRELSPDSEVIPNLLSISLKTNVLIRPFDLVKAESKLTNWPLYFAREFGHFPLEEMEEWMRALHQAGVKHFLLDHMHHAVDDEDYKVIARFARGLKSLVKELDVAFILVIQPKVLRPDDKVNFSSIRGGAAGGQAIDALVTLEREKDENNRPTDVTKVTLDIARHKLAKPGVIYLQYNRDTMDFIEVEEVKEEEPKIAHEFSKRVT